MFILLSFGSLCTFRGVLPQINTVLFKNLYQANFGTDLIAVRNEAETRQTPYLVFLYSNSCPHCYRMSHTLAAPEVYEMLTPYPKVAISDQAARDMREKYDLHGFPQFLVFSPDHEFLGPISGEHPPARFIEKFKELEIENSENSATR